MQFHRSMTLLRKKGFAYEAMDGSGVYFSTHKVGKSYGKLDPRRQTLENAEMQAKAVAAVEESQVVEEEEKAKKDP
ncbi:unnamed protein product [Peronospora effusa]|nr:unnamed protein product [Peronospora effusa]